MPSGNKQLPEPMSGQTYVAIWRHYSTMTHNSNSRSLSLQPSPNNSLKPELNGVFADDIFISLKKIFVFCFENSLKFFLCEPIQNKSSLVQLMALRQTDDKLLPETSMNTFSDAYVWQG